MDRWEFIWSPVSHQEGSYVSYTFVDEDGFSPFDPPWALTTSWLMIDHDPWDTGVEWAANLTRS